MKYFVPTLALGALSPPQSQLTDKFGGLPWGLPASRWPLCAECGNPQTHLATFTHSAGRLDLGAEGRTVLVFQCGHSPNETDCENYTAGSGANAVVFLDAHELGSGLTVPPAPGTPKQIEMRVTEWGEQHDLVTPEMEPSFLCGDSYWQDDEATEIVSASVADGAKLGSVPAWIQGGAGTDPAFRFVAQLGYAYHFSDPMPTADAAGATISRWNKGERKPQVNQPTNPDPDLRGEIYVSDITLLRYGSGYLFINTDLITPQGLFLWQCG